MKKDASKRLAGRAETTENRVAVDVSKMTTTDQGHLLFYILVRGVEGAIHKSVSNEAHTIIVTGRLIPNKREQVVDRYEMIFI